MQFAYIFILFCLVAVTHGDNSDLTIISNQKTFSPGAGPGINPMKGWNTGWGLDYGHASVGFQYIPWKVVEPQKDFYVFSEVEKIINRRGSRGRHLILRLYADWGCQDKVSGGGPSWLYNDLGVKYLTNGALYVTDYNNPVYIAQAIELIQEFGKRYNNDHRIYAIELGILGYWGEWHTSGFLTYTISSSTQQQILDAYLASFPNKLLMGRNPWRTILNATNKVGYHNDYFYPAHRHSDEFDTSIDSGNKWLNGPIGGETPPSFSTPNSSKYANYDALFKTPIGENIIKKGHYSTMKIDDVCNDTEQALYCQNFTKLHRMMGYNYQLTTGEFPDSIGNISSLSVLVRMKNIGVAPMYYNWRVEIALLNPALNNLAVSVNQTSIALKSILPQNESLIEANLEGLSNLNDSEYKLALRISQPEADMDKSASWGLNARNVYIEFANDLPVLPGSWNEKNALVGGWTILGNITKTNI